MGEPERLITGGGAKKRWRSQVQLLLSAASTENPFLTLAGAGCAVRSSWLVPLSLPHRQLCQGCIGRKCAGGFLIKLMRWGCWQQTHLSGPWHFEMSRSSLRSSRAPEREEDGTGISRSSNYGETGNTSPRCVEQPGVDSQPFWHKLSYLRFPLSAVVFVPLLHVNWSFLFFFSIFGWNICF